MNRKTIQQAVELERIAREDNRLERADRFLLLQIAREIRLRAAASGRKRVHGSTRERYAFHNARRRLRRLEGKTGKEELD
jgi:hypothetical protein